MPKLPKPPARTVATRTVVVKGQKISVTIASEPAKSAARSQKAPAKKAK